VQDGDRGLTRLQRAADQDDLDWARQLVKVGIVQRKSAAACAGLRDILRSEDGPIVAELADVLF
jgi:hypothetical protein